MKKITSILAALFLAGVGSAWAAPYTPSMTADTFDTTPDAVATPNDTGVLITDNKDLHDAVNVLMGTSYANNEAIDGLQYTGDDRFWTDFSTTDISAGYALIGLSAGNNNTLYVYDVTNPGVPLDVFGTSFTGFQLTGDGTFANPFPAAVSPLAGGTNFGWRLGSFDGTSTVTWDSDPSVNPDQLDHMITYHLSGLAGKSVYLNYLTGPDAGNTVQYTFFDPYLIGWEDLSLAQNGAFSDQDYNDMMYIFDRVAPPPVIPEPMTMAMFGAGLLGAAGVRRFRRRACA